MVNINLILSNSKVADKYHLNYYDHDQQSGLQCQWCSQGCVVSCKYWGEGSLDAYFLCTISKFTNFESWCIVGNIFVNFFENFIIFVFPTKCKYHEGMKLFEISNLKCGRIPSGHLTLEMVLYKNAVDSLFTISTCLI